MGIDPSATTASEYPRDRSGPGPASERAGDGIGPYYLMEIIGRGGFGDVWLAERREPMVQRVALKVIKPGMDSRAVIARFEQERQALAVMDHPNVARVFDGGVTALGRPYFVMEYVKGEPITDYCDRKSLSIRERLELFIPVCEAVQHAHHKGIIHRDLKPSNVLVMETEGRAIPKVIDFGIAKAIDQTTVEQTAFSLEGHFIGTPEYMSPEQAGGQADIDTRTDVYSLGVLLYELLVGQLPFESAALRLKGRDELRRIIREEEPPRPSTRLGEIGNAADRIATARRDSRASMLRELRRDLEWVPLKALRKERERRYGSPAALAEDIRRYLDGRPLRAAPESRAYRARKFVRRNRPLVVGVAAVVLALSAGLAGTIWQAREAARQAEEASKQAGRANERAVAAEKAERAEKERADQLKQVSDFQSQMLSQIDTTKAGLDLMADIRARFTATLEKAGVPEEERKSRLDALQQELVRVNATDAAAAMIDRTILRPAVKTIDEQFKDDPSTDASLRQALAVLYRTLGLNDAALPLQESALATRRRVLGEEHADTLASIANMGTLLHSQGKLDQAEWYFRDALEKSLRVHGDEHPDTFSSISNVGVVLEARGKLSEAESYAREALEKRRRVLGVEHPDALASTAFMGVLLVNQGKFAEAEPYVREVQEKFRRALGEDHPDTITAISNMGGLLQAQGKLDQAEPYWLEALEKSRRVLGEEHPNTLSSINTIGFLLQAQGKFAEAEPYFREALETRRRVLGKEHPDTLTSINNLGFVLKVQGKLDQAEPYYREAVEKHRRVLGDEHPKTLIAISNMGMLLLAQDKFQEAEPYLREALEKRRLTLGQMHPDTLASVNNMGVFFRHQGMLAEAERYFREAVDKMRLVAGAEHPDTLICITSLAFLIDSQGRHQEAVDLLAPAEPAAREAFTGGNAPRLARFLTALGGARIALGSDSDGFQLAEANLVEAHSIFVEVSGDAHKDTLACLQALIDLYAAWDAAEPGQGYDAKAAEWKAKLDAAKPAASTEPKTPGGG